MKRAFVLLCCLALSAISLAAEKSLSPRHLLKMSEVEAAEKSGGEVTLRGIVVFVSGIEASRFVVAPEDAPKTQGVVVFDRTEGGRPALGDLVHARGRIGWQNGHAVIEASKLDVVRNESLAPTGSVKQADFRRGILDGRRISLSGTVREVRQQDSEEGAVSTLSLYLDNYTAVVRVPGHLNPTNYVGKPIRVTGLAVSHLDSNGGFLDAELEVAEETDIIDLSPEVQARTYLRISIVFGAVLLLVSVVLLFLWWRGRRVRREMEVIAAERRRMAADLHDTIEQHLAGANLLVAGMMSQEGVSEEIRETMKILTSLLANAKAEVRSAVLNLRSTGDSEKTLEARLGEMAKALDKAGVKTRKCLRGLPTTLPEGIHQDIILIVREATTNAVKHGKAKNIVFTADPVTPQGFVLRILNDGAPFEVDRTLGPETGHYGLSGMKERALRNHLEIGWGVKEGWTYVELRTEKELS